MTNWQSTLRSIHLKKGNRIIIKIWVTILTCIDRINFVLCYFQKNECEISLINSFLAVWEFLWSNIYLVVFFVLSKVNDSGVILIDSLHFKFLSCFYFFWMTIIDHPIQRTDEEKSSTCRLYIARVSSDG